jgi:hypothetical protein
MILSAMTITGEYRSGLIRATFIATPRRTRVSLCDAAGTGKPDLPTGWAPGAPSVAGPLVLGPARQTLLPATCAAWSGFRGIRCRVDTTRLRLVSGGYAAA